MKATVTLMGEPVEIGILDHIPIRAADEAARLDNLQQGRRPDVDAELARRVQAMPAYEYAARRRELGTAGPDLVEFLGGAR